MKRRSDHITRHWWLKSLAEFPELKLILLEQQILFVGIEEEGLNLIWLKKNCK